MFFLFLYKSFGLIHIDLHLQLFIKKCRLYVHFVNLLVHGGSDSMYALNGDEW